MSSEKLLIVHARKYNFQDAENGRTVEGMTLTCLNGVTADKPDERGQAPIKLSCDMQLWRQITTIPGVYNVRTGMAAGAQGKAKVEVREVQHVADFAIDPEKVHGPSLAKVG